MCNGSIDIAPTGQPPFYYNWSTGQSTQNITGICNGIYSLTVTDVSSCSFSFSIAVGNNDGFAFVTGTDATCSGCCNGTGEITVTVGYPPYTYLWSGG